MLSTPQNRTEDSLYTYKSIPAIYFKNYRTISKWFRPASRSIRLFGQARSRVHLHALQTLRVPLIRHLTCIPTRADCRPCPSLPATLIPVSGRAAIACPRPWVRGGSTTARIPQPRARIDASDRIVAWQSSKPYTVSANKQDNGTLTSVHFLVDRASL